MRHKNGKMCCGLMSPHLRLFWEIIYIVSARLKTKKYHLHSYQCKVQKPALVMVWGHFVAFLLHKKV